MYKLIVLRGMVIEDMDEFINSFTQDVCEEEADVFRGVFRELEKEWPHCVYVNDLTELTEGEEEKLLQCMIAAGGFDLESLGIYTRH